MPFGYGERTVSRGYGAQVYALSRLGYKTEAVISSVAPAHPTSPLRFSAFLCNACVRRETYGGMTWLVARGTLMDRDGGKEDIRIYA